MQWFCVCYNPSMIYKTRPVYIDGYGFDDTPLEVGLFGWCALTIARIWMAFAFLVAIIAGIAVLILCLPLMLPAAGIFAVVPDKKEDIDSEEATSPL